MRFFLLSILAVVAAGCIAPNTSLVPDTILEQSDTSTTQAAPVPAVAQEAEEHTVQPILDPHFTATVLCAVAPAPSTDAGVAGTDPCQRPPDDLSRVEFNGYVLNARTLWMLQLADNIYMGRGDPLRVTQGSYTEGEELSFGTHSGGGAVDISIRVKSDPSQILSVDGEAEELVHALRLAGFAAWLRLPEDMTPSVSLHIHAIAVGDPTLSPAALQQLIGPEGYFRGFDGVPPEFGGPHQDRYGGPVVCDWMIEMGFTELQ